jgi:hypothetical protein
MPPRVRNQGALKKKPLLEKRLEIVVQALIVQIDNASAGIGTFPCSGGLPRFLRAGPSTALDERFRAYATVKWTKFTTFFPGLSTHRHSSICRWLF